MIDYETIARSNHRNGMNCTSAVYDAFGMSNLSCFPYVQITPSIFDHLN